MAWCKLESTFRNHPKIGRLARRLEISKTEARGLVTGLWSWAVDYAVDGNLVDLTDDEIAEAADWSGPPNRLVEAMLATKLLDKNENGVAIHGWMRRAGSYNQALRKSRQRAKAAKSNENMQDDEIVSRDGHGTVPGQSRDSPATVTKMSHREREREREREKDICQTSSLTALSAQSKKSIDKRLDQSADIQTVWGAYREHHPHCAGSLKSSRKEYRLIKARLADGFARAQLISAINGYHKSPFHLGDNDQGKQYLSLALIMRDAPHVESGIEYDTKKDIGKKPVEFLTDEEKERERIRRNNEIKDAEARARQGLPPRRKRNESRA